MTNISRPRFARVFALAVALAVLALGATDPAAARRGRGGGGDDDDGLKLRMNDAVAVPGGTVALVVRTYAARPIRQGRITVRVRRPAPAKLGFGVEELTQPAGPLTFERAVVFSRRGDAVTTATATGNPDGHSIRIDFQSRTATINAVDGPLAVIFLRLAKNAVPGERFSVELDPALTGLTDAAGAALPLEPIAAELVVRAPQAPFAVEAEGDEVEPGENAELGVNTAEVFPVSGGRMVLRYDPAAASGLPVVTMDPRYGKATFQVDTSVPGRLVVTFQSPDASLNTIPGRFLAIDLRTRASAPIGWETPLVLDPAGSWLRAKRGNRKLSIRLENGSLAFE